MADGKGCVCAAKSSSDCACDADWTPREVYELRGLLDRMASLLRKVYEIIPAKKDYEECEKVLAEYEAMRGGK